MKQTIEEIAKKHAFQCHKTLNNKYGDMDYSFHLIKTREIAECYKHHIPIDDRYDVFGAIYEHDTLEDCKKLCSFSELITITNLRIALIVKAVTTNEGTRKERFNDEYYENIKKTKYATFVKLCDRISNVEQCIYNNNISKLKMYEKEYSLFKEKLHKNDEYEDMWMQLDYLLN
jgi:hypothetical protein